MTSKLFAVYLGGRAPRCNTELHDVVFVTGPSIEATYDHLMDLWFGAPERLHLDSYMELDIVDGHRVTLADTAPDNGKSLYFINLGGYADGLFTELHANMIVVAANEQEAKARAKRDLMRNGEQEVHTDDLYDVDDCLEISRIGAHHVVLEPTTATSTPWPVNGYHIIPNEIIAAYLARHPERATKGPVAG